MLDINNRITQLPGDLFSIKSEYLNKIESLSINNIESSIVLIGKAG